VRRALHRPVAAILLVSSEDQPLTFLAQIRGPVEIHGRGNFTSQFRKFRNVVRDDVLMLHRYDRQLGSHHAADFPCPEACRVHDILGSDVPLRRFHQPFFARQSFQPGHRRVSIDLGAGVARRLCIGMRHPAGIDVAVVWIEHCRAIIGSLDQWIEPLRFGKIDEIQRQSEMTRLRSLGLEEFDLPVAHGEIQAAGLVNAAGDAGLAFDFAIELDSVILKRRDVRVSVQGVHSAGCMPRRAGSEFRPFQQDGIVHSKLGQVVENAATNNATADHDDSCLRFHATLDEGRAVLLPGSPTNA
jgi:hypothetical protein